MGDSTESGENAEIIGEQGKGKRKLRRIKTPSGAINTAEDVDRI
jgi:hypothetical protein